MRAIPKEMYHFLVQFHTEDSLVSPDRTHLISPVPFSCSNTDECSIAADLGIPSCNAAIIARLTIMQSKHPVASLSNMIRLS